MFSIQTGSAGQGGAQRRQGSQSSLTRAVIQPSKTQARESRVYVTALVCGTEMG